MKSFEEVKDILSSHKSEIREKYNIKELGVFGSYVRGEQNKTSDIDVLVDFTEPIGFIKFMQCEEYLETLLGTKVDLVSRGALKPIIGKYILKEVVKI